MENGTLWSCENYQKHSHKKSINTSKLQDLTPCEPQRYVHGRSRTKQAKINMNQLAEVYQTSAITHIIISWIKHFLFEGTIQA
jgi:hypothetical protein